MPTRDFVIKNGMSVNNTLLVANSSTSKVGVGNNAPVVTFHITANDAVLIAVGNTGQRPTGANGYLRYNTDLTTFEGFSNNTWGPIGGGVSVAGANTYIQFNNSGSLGASANLTFNGTTLTIQTIVAPGILDHQTLSTNTTAANVGGITISNAGFVALIGNSTVTAAQADATGFRVQKQRLQSLGSLSTLTPDCSNGNIFEFTLSANATINAPTNIQPGFYTFIVHNSTFFITSWNAAYKWPGGTAPASTASGTDVFSFVANTTVFLGSMVPGLA